MRVMRNEGKKVVDIARMFEVSVPHASNILNGKAWK